jgi:hypothetical protein
MIPEEFAKAARWARVPVAQQLCDLFAQEGANIGNRQSACQGSDYQRQNEESAAARATRRLRLMLR